MWVTESNRPVPSQSASRHLFLISYIYFSLLPLHINDRFFVVVVFWKLGSSVFMELFLTIFSTRFHLEQVSLDFLL